MKRYPKTKISNELLVFKTYECQKHINKMINASVVNSSIDDSVDNLETAQKRMNASLDELLYQQQQKVQQDIRIEKNRKEIMIIAAIGLSIMIVIFLIFLFIFNFPGKSKSGQGGTASLETSIFLEEIE